MTCIYSAETKDSVLKRLRDPILSIGLTDITVNFSVNVDLLELLDVLNASPNTNVARLDVSSSVCAPRIVEKIGEFLMHSKTLRSLSLWIHKYDLKSYTGLSNALKFNTTLEELHLREECQNKTVTDVFFEMMAVRQKGSYKIYLGSRELFGERLDLLMAKGLEEIFQANTKPFAQFTIMNEEIGPRAGDAIAKEITTTTSRIGLIFRGAKVSTEAALTIAYAMKRTKTIGLLLFTLTDDALAKDREIIQHAFEHAFWYNSRLPRGSAWYIFDEKQNIFIEIFLKYAKHLNRPFASLNLNFE